MNGSDATRSASAQSIRATDAASIDPAGLVRRVRRNADLSQRDLAAAIGVQQSQVARWETGSQRVDIGVLSEILAIAGFRLLVVDPDGNPVSPMSTDTIHDHGGRRFPAHLDVVPLTERPGSVLLRQRPDRPTPRAWYEGRLARDRRRIAQHLATDDEHPTESDFAAGRALESRVARERAREAALAAVAPICSCPDECSMAPRCVAGCSCGCDL